MVGRHLSLANRFVAGLFTPLSPITAFVVFMQVLALKKFSNRSI